MKPEYVAMLVMFGALASGTIAAYKRRGPLGWMLFGALAPLISVIVLSAIKDLPES